MRKKKSLRKWNHIWISKLISQLLLICSRIGSIFNELVCPKSSLVISFLVLKAFLDLFWRLLLFWLVLDLIKCLGRRLCRCILRMGRKSLRWARIFRWMRMMRRMKRLRRKMKLFWNMDWSWVIFKNIWSPLISMKDFLSFYVIILRKRNLIGLLHLKVWIKVLKFGTMEGKIFHWLRWFFSI